MWISVVITVHGTAYDGTGEEGCRRKPPAIVLPVSSAALPEAAMIVVIGAVAAISDAVIAVAPEPLVSLDAAAQRFNLDDVG